MHPVTRRIVQAVLYELGGLVIAMTILGNLFDTALGSVFLLSVIMSTTALLWNYAFNAMFERWEATQITKGRSVWRRMAHGVGFEGGLTLFLVPLMAYWLETSLLEALFAQIGILLVFLIYTIAFTWAFDKVFGLPASAVN
jgi:uncharacterized membrane protein